MARHRPVGVAVRGGQYSLGSAGFDCGALPSYSSRRPDDYNVPLCKGQSSVPSDLLNPHLRDTPVLRPISSRAEQFKKKFPDYLKQAGLK